MFQSVFWQNWISLEQKGEICDIDLPKLENNADQFGHILPSFIKLNIFDMLNTFGVISSKI